MSATTTPQSHLMFSLGAGNSRAHSTGGTLPAGPQWPWQAEVICHCRRAFTDYSFQLSFHQNSFQKAEKFYLQDCNYPTDMDGQGPRFSPSINKIFTDSFWGKKPQPYSWRKQNKVMSSTFPAQCYSTKYFLVYKTICHKFLSRCSLERDFFLTHQQHIFSNCKGHL